MKIAIKMTTIANMTKKLDKDIFFNKNTRLKMINFEERRAQKAEKFRELASKNEAKSEQLYVESKKMQDCIPFGQPILVGHYSEKSDRNFRDRIHNKMGQSFEAADKAKYYERRAEAMENNRKIFSDDPQATEKLSAKIERLETAHKTMREFNRLLRKKDIEGMLNLGFTESQINKLSIPDFCGRVGFADYVLSNSSANINALKKRLAIEIQKANDITSQKDINGVTIVENVEENRVQMFFDGKPVEEVRSKLKHSGFRWSPFNGCWQLNRSSMATYKAEKIANELIK